MSSEIFSPWTSNNHQITWINPHSIYLLGSWSVFGPAGPAIEPKRGSPEAKRVLCPFNRNAFHHPSRKKNERSENVSKSTMYILCLLYVWCWSSLLCIHLSLLMTHDKPLNLCRASRGPLGVSTCFFGHHNLWRTKWNDKEWRLIPFSQGAVQDPLVDQHLWPSKTLHRVTRTPQIGDQTH